MPPVRPVPESITSLSDQELANKIRSYGVKIGPIVTSTRRVYERKLYQLETGLQAAYQYPPVDDDEEDEDEDEAGAAADEDSADDEVSFHQQPRQRTTRPTRQEYSAREEIRKPLPRKPLHASTTSPRYISPPSERRSKPASSKSQTEESSRGLPLWVKLVAIIIVAVIVFLVIKNMEPNPASSIPDQIEVNV